MSSSFLTEDLNHLVICPAAIRPETKDGKPFPGTDIGFVFSRPATRPVAFKRPAATDPKSFMKPPHGAFSISSTLYLLDNGATKLRLFTPSS